LTLSFVRSPKYGEKLKSNQVDWLGIILWHLSSAPYNLLEHGQQDDWFNNKLIVLLSAVSVFGVLFIWRQLTYKYPIVNLSVLKDGNLRIGTLWLLFSVLIVRFYINNPIYTQSILGTATDAGLLRFLDNDCFYDAYYW
jgi:DHA2 family multidrug resistance protein